MVDDAVRKVFKEAKVPVRGLIVDLVEYPTSPVPFPDGHVELARGYLTLRVYRDNIESLSEPDKVIASEYVYKLAQTIEDLGYRCFPEGVEETPKGVV